MDQLSNLNIDFVSALLLRLTFIPVNCSCNSFALFLVDKVATKGKCFVSVIAKVPAPVELVITQFADHVIMMLISQIIKGNANSYFCVIPKNHWLMFVSWKY